MFSVEQRPGSFPLKKNFADFLFEWGRQLAATPGTPLKASLSYRHGLGFVATREGANLARLGEHDLVLLELDTELPGRLTVHGGAPPPSEGWIHGLAFACRGGAIFSFFCQDTTCAAARVEESELNDPARAIPAFEAALGKGNLVQVGQRGVLSIGCTAQDAGEPLLALRR